MNAFVAFCVLGFIFGLGPVGWSVGFLILFMVWACREKPNDPAHTGLCAQCGNLLYTEGRVLCHACMEQLRDHMRE